MAKSGKGSSFERGVCVELSKWWSDDKHEDIFWRTSTSGARATTRQKKGQRTSNQHGDVCAIDTDGQPLIDLLTIELKRGYAKNSIQDLIDRLPTAAAQEIEVWINKAIISRKASGSRSWIIIMRKDRRKALVLMPSVLFTRLFPNGIDHYRHELPTLFFFNTKLRILLEKGKRKVKKKGKVKKLMIYGMTLGNFFSAVSRKDIEGLL